MKHVRQRPFTFQRWPIHGSHWGVCAREINPDAWTNHFYPRFHGTRRKSVIHTSWSLCTHTFLCISVLRGEAPSDKSSEKSMITY